MLQTVINKFISDENGSTAIEYGLIGVLIVIAITAAISSVGSSLNSNFYQKILDAFTL